MVMSTGGTTPASLLVTHPHANLVHENALENPGHQPDGDGELHCGGLPTRVLHLRKARQKLDERTNTAPNARRLEGHIVQLVREVIADPPDDLQDSRKSIVDESEPLAHEDPCVERAERCQAALEKLVLGARVRTEHLRKRATQEAFDITAAEDRRCAVVRERHPKQHVDRAGWRIHAATIPGRSV